MRLPLSASGQFSQRGFRQCWTWWPWFPNVGGLTVHRCLVAQSASASSPRPPSVSPSVHRCCLAHCSVCGQCFRSSAGYRRHNCNRAKDLPSLINRSAFPLQCVQCRRSFRRSQDLYRHMAHCKRLQTL